MAQKIVDNDIQELSEDLTQLEHEIERVHAVTACANLMNMYQVYCWKVMRQPITPMFATKTPGLRVEMLWGVYDGADGFMKFQKFHYLGKPRQAGINTFHTMLTPIIEVAKDGQTARGLWIFFGTETFVDLEGKVGVDWAGGQFAMDFIKEDGEWKIWRYTTTGLMASSFDRGWHVEDQEFLEKSIQYGNSMVPEDQRPDRPTSYPWMWGPDDYFQNIPLIPLPYETWDDSLECIPAPGKQWKIEKFE